MGYGIKVSKGTKIRHRYNQVLIYKKLISPTGKGFASKIVPDWTAPIRDYLFLSSALDLLSIRKAQPNLRIKSSLGCT